MTALDGLIDALHDHFVLEALGPLGCECPQMSDEEHVAAFVLAHLAAQDTTPVPTAALDALRDAFTCKPGNDEDFMSDVAALDFLAAVDALNEGDH